MEDRELVWNRIAQAVTKIAKVKKVDVPADLLKTTGTVFERDAKRKAALGEFCNKAGVPINEVIDERLVIIANILDDNALQLMGVSNKPEGGKDKPAQSQGKPAESS